MKALGIHSERTPAQRPWSIGVGAICVLLVLGPGVCLTGCVTRAKANAQARAAFLEGQRLGMLQASQQSNAPSVKFVGPVQHPVIVWFPGLTLGEAILQAIYSSPNDPKNILIQRGTVRIPIDAQSLLQGAKIPLEAGDTIIFEP